MNTLLIFFALPIATIVISIALQKILKCPSLVSAIVFAIFLIVTFVINNLEFLIATIVYTIISFITASLFCFIQRLFNKGNLDTLSRFNNQCSCNNLNNDNDILTINSQYQDNGNGGVITLNTFNDNQSNNCNCCNNNSTNNGVTARINVIPNSNTNGRTGSLCGNYRRG
jgi:hypothetical protein